MTDRWRVVIVIVLFLCAAVAITLFGRLSERFYEESFFTCDDVCRAMPFIEEGRDVPPFVHFPIYMARFTLEAAATNNYQVQLPENICLGEKTVLITDSVTGFQWLTNGLGTRYIVL